MMLTLALSLLVNVYDTAGLSRTDLLHAEATAAAILSPAGIAVEWRDCRPACDAPVSPSTLALRIVTAADGSRASSLGYTFVSGGDELGALATIVATRVRAMAREAGCDVGTLVGRAMAHEVGHALLGTSEHGAHGLMRATWKASELCRDRPDDWMFSRDEAARMRGRLAARLQAANQIASSASWCVPCMLPCRAGETCAAASLP
jgi:hypothetical protein